MEAMERVFSKLTLDGAEFVNRFVFPPIKTGYGNPQGTVTKDHEIFYRRISRNGPGLVILEPVSVTPDGKEHPKQLCVHLPESASELTKIVEIVHGEGRLACLHLNHAGAAANPKASGGPPKAPSPFTCPSSGQSSLELNEEEIENIIAGFRSAAEKAKAAGFDVIEIQGGHGYLLSQFLNGKINKRSDRWGKDRTLFAGRVLDAVREGAPDIPRILRISGNEMSPDHGVDPEDLRPLIESALATDVSALHVGMGNVCFSPPWYFHHMSLPEKPRIDALSRIREFVSLPLIVAGRLGDREKIAELLDKGLADLVALGRPLIADPDLLDKWRRDANEEVNRCGYCLQGCLHRVKSGEGLGCNINPEIREPELERTDNPLKILVAGGGPAGMSAALYLTRCGHAVTLAEKEDFLGGQFALAWRAPGKESMKRTLDSLEHAVRTCGASILLQRPVDAELVKELRPDLLVWATGGVQNVPEIPGLPDQRILTSLEYFRGDKEVQGPRVLVIGAGRTGIEIAEKLGMDGFDVVATKRTDPIGSNMEMVTRKLALARLGKLPNVTLMPHTTVKEFKAEGVEMEKDGEKITTEPFQTVILASGIRPAALPEEEIGGALPKVEIIGDALDVKDIYSAVHAGYRPARQY
jgi:2,4-dienoyl-CoA reductase-like NADH-dependent reductase (Old Yellow Enzyme family)/thioredoxin reductase